LMCTVFAPGKYSRFMKGGVCCSGEVSTVASCFYNHVLTASETAGDSNGGVRAVLLFPLWRADSWLPHFGWCNLETNSGFKHLCIRTQIPIHFVCIYL